MSVRAARHDKNSTSRPAKVPLRWSLVSPWYPLPASMLLTLAKGWRVAIYSRYHDDAVT